MYGEKPYRARMEVAQNDDGSAQKAGILHSFAEFFEKQSPHNLRRRKGGFLLSLDRGE
jgi:hypothetical protein